MSPTGEQRQGFNALISIFEQFESPEAEVRTIINFDSGWTILVWLVGPVLGIFGGPLT